MLIMYLTIALVQLDLLITVILLAMQIFQPLLLLLHNALTML